MKRYIVKCKNCGKGYTVVIDDTQFFGVDELRCTCSNYPEMIIETKWLGSFKDAHPDIEELQVKNVEVITEKATSE